MSFNRMSVIIGLLYAVSLCSSALRMSFNRKSVIIGLLYAVSLSYLTELISVDTDTWDAPGHDLPCSQNFTYARDRHARTIRNASAAHRPWIPRTIHFLIPSRCIPSSVANAHEEAWKNEPKLSDHSILYHDQAELDRYMASDRHKKDFPSIELAYTCARSARAKSDIARFLTLWEFGGIAVDASLIPGPAFLRNDASSNRTDGIIIDDRDESLVEVDGDWNAKPRFIAAEPRHPAIFVAIEKFLASSMQLVRESTGPRELLAAKWTNYWAGNYTALRGSFYAGFDSKFYHGSENGTEVKNYGTNKVGFMPNKIVRIRVDDAIHGALFESIRLTEIEERALELTVRSERQEQCKLVESKLEDHSYQTDIESLIKMAGADAGAEEEQDNTCPRGQMRVPSKFDANSILPGRKIPKIIHMTAKSSCFTPRFAKNVEKWRFPGHSLFIYDDAAMNTLFRHFDWPEFPLLREVLSCIPSGGGKADLWRYLMLWEYGGIYTDIDNAPGVGLLNGTVIENHTDSLFEQERGGFPSQYFMAASPHHPVMFYMVQRTIFRLLTEVKSIRDQYVPFVTGPGATKDAMKIVIGQGYPTRGQYAGVNGRNVTIIGHRAAQGHYVVRLFERGAMVDYRRMNMTHYSKIEAIPAPSHSCLMELYKNAGYL